jgi:hypothetical protein
MLTGCHLLNKTRVQQSKTNNVKQVPIIGRDPKTVEFSKPGFEPGLTIETVSAILNLN